MSGSCSQPHPTTLAKMLYPTSRTEKLPLFTLCGTPAKALFKNNGCLNGKMKGMERL